MTAKASKSSNKLLVTPRQDHLALDGAIATLAKETGQDRLLIRSDGGAEAHRYYRGGNTFPLADAATKAAGLLKAWGDPLQIEDLLLLPPGS